MKKKRLYAVKKYFTRRLSAYKKRFRLLFPLESAGKNRRNRPFAEVFTMFSACKAHSTT